MVNNQKAGFTANECTNSYGTAKNENLQTKNYLIVCHKLMNWFSEFVFSGRTSFVSLRAYSTQIWRPSLRA